MEPTRTYEARAQTTPLQSKRQGQAASAAAELLAPADRASLGHLFTLAYSERSHLQP